jgi:signal transduction histidine kinase
VPVFNADGSVREWIGTSMDVSRRKAAERALQQANQTLRRLAARREAVREEERARIAQNLHDGAGQSINLLRLKLAAIARRPGDEARAAQLAEAQGIIDQINQEIRSLEFELSPPVLRQLGLVPAIGWLAEDMQRSYGLGVVVNDDEEEKPLDQTLLASMFRAVRELLINVAKHANVNTAHVDIQRAEGNILITVSDMGSGFDLAKLDRLETTGLGLAGVRERTEFAGGSLHVSSVPGAGTTVTITMPLSEKTL